MFLDELKHLGSGAGSAETPDFLPVPEQDDGGETPDAVMAGEFHIFAGIDFQLDQTYRPLKLRRNTFQNRCQHQAGRTPVSPEVNQDRSLLRRGQHVLFEMFETCFPYRHIAYYTQRRCWLQLPPGWVTGVLAQSRARRRRPAVLSPVSTHTTNR